MNLRPVVRATSVAVALVVLLGGCSGSGGSEAKQPEKIPGGYRVDLSPSEHSDLSGQARLVVSSSVLRVTLELHNLESATPYNAHLHRGSCREGTGGGVNLNPVVGTDDGSGTSATTVPMSHLNPSYDHALMVHLPKGHHALCGDIPSVRMLKKRKQ